MKKNEMRELLFPRERLKLWFIMKNLLLLLLIPMMTSTASVFSQVGKVSLRVENMTLTEIFQKIEAETEYTFLFRVEQVREVKNITMDYTDVDIRIVLNECLTKNGLTWKMVDNTIIVTTAPPVRDTTDKKNVKKQKVYGIVTDKLGEPLPGVGVVIKGTTMGVATDMKGHYSIELPDMKDIQLIFSFIGMKSQTLKVGNKMEINVTLEEDIQSVDEVVVTGYQIIDKKKLTSAVTSVKMEDIMVQGATSIDKMLEGQIPDLMLTVNSGEVGVVPRIRIRGTSTLVGNREPLWVVDGIVVTDPVPLSADVLNDPDYVNRIGNAIAGINPQDIERLDILKDAAATALYGTKAANGVIVITTKKGHIGAPRVSYNTSITYKRRPRYSDRKIDLMNSKERVGFSRDLVNMHYIYPANMDFAGYELLVQQLHNREISEEEFNSEVARLETVNTDWFDLLTKDAFSHQHTLSLSGGSEQGRYYASLGYSRDNDVIRNAYNDRYTVMMSLSSNFGKWLTASFNLSGNISERNYNQSSLNVIDYAYKTSRAIPAFTEEGEYEYYDRASTSHNGQKFGYNILNDMENSYDQQESSSISLNTNLQFKFTDWLKGNLTMAYTTTNTNMENYWGEKTYYAADLRGDLTQRDGAGEASSLMPYGGQLSITESRNRAYTLRAQVDVNKYFGEEQNHNFNMSIGYEMSSTRGKGYSNTMRGYFPERGKKVVTSVDKDKYIMYADWMLKNTPGISDSQNNLLSIYGTIGYSYGGFFNINFNTRYDGSNKFGSRSNEKLLPIWAVAASYNIAAHTGMKSKWVSNLSVKVSYGYQGNMLDGQSPVMLLKMGTLDDYYGKYTSSIDTYANPDLRWEKTSSFNVGLDLGLFENKIAIAGDFYYKKTKDAFMNRTISTINGLSSYTVNSGIVENTGFNVAVTLIPIRTEDFRWVFSTSYSYTFNDLKTLPGQETNEMGDFLSGTALVKGEAVGTFFSYKYIGLNPLNGAPMFDDYEERSDALKGLGKYDTFTKVLTPSGRREPFASGSFNNTFTYKNWRVAISMAYSLGAKTRLFRLYPNNQPEFAATQNVSREFLKRWQNPGDEARTDIPAVFSSADISNQRYFTHYSQANTSNGGFAIATNAWQMFDNGDHRVVSADYLKCTNLSLNYRFTSKILSTLKLSNLEVALSTTNLFTICNKKLKGQTPTQGGFSEVQLSERPTFSFSVNLTF